MDPRLKHPFPALIAGPTCCGKTQFVKRLLEAGEEMIEGAPEKIIWCYGIYQQAYDEMQRTIPNLTFMEGLPSDLESMNLKILNPLTLGDRCLCSRNAEKIEFWFRTLLRFMMNKSHFYFNLGKKISLRVSFSAELLSVSCVEDRSFVLYAPFIIRMYDCE